MQGLPKVVETWTSAQSFLPTLWKCSPVFNGIQGIEAKLVQSHSQIYAAPWKCCPVFSMVSLGSHQCSYFYLEVSSSPAVLCAHAKTGLQNAGLVQKSVLFVNPYPGCLHQCADIVINIQAALLYGWVVSPLCTATFWKGKLHIVKHFTVCYMYMSFGTTYTLSSVACRQSSQAVKIKGKPQCMMTLAGPQLSNGHSKAPVSSSSRQNYSGILPAKQDFKEKAASEADR